MAASVYRVTVLVGTSIESWERAAQVAIERAAGSLRDLCVARTIEQDIQIQPGELLTYRVKMELSFKSDASGQPVASDDEDLSDVNLVDAALDE